MSSTTENWSQTCTKERKEKKMATIPTRRRRHSGSLDGSEGLKTPFPTKFLAGTAIGVEEPPRPKSSPGERPVQRRRQMSPDHDSNSDRENKYEGDPQPSIVMDIDDEEIKNPVISLHYPCVGSQLVDTSGSITIVTNNGSPTTSTKNPTGPNERPTKPLPSSKVRKMASTAPPSTDQNTQVPPIKLVANPSMLPVQAHVPRGPAATSTRRLFVVLEQACLEAYRVSSGGHSQGKYSRGGSRGGREGDVKYTLLNCDDHQGILAKTGRDIADARPDITHQVLLKFFRDCPEGSFFSNVGSVF